MRSKRICFPPKGFDYKAMIFLYMSSITCLQLGDLFFKSEINLVEATSINYGTIQQPITDMNLLMPQLCQNQSVICEGSFCIPGVRKCVCDLRMPVQFGVFCLRQVDIETKCFVTNQCNHTVKDAVCIDITSNTLLTSESSKHKLDQWRQLYELRQMSQSANLGKNSAFSTTTEFQPAPIDAHQKVLVVSHDIESQQQFMSNLRNSPYEINYDTQKLLSQNHTRRLTNKVDKSIDPVSSASNNSGSQESRSSNSENKSSNSFSLSSDRIENGQPSKEKISVSTTPITTSTIKYSTTRQTDTTTAVPVRSDLGGRKVTIKNSYWPPGVCSCPSGFMFDSMTRKCMALSLADSHCMSDADCNQISMTHCSSDSKRCECDEPLVWNHTELACVRTKPEVKVDNSVIRDMSHGMVESLIPQSILAKLLPDYATMLFIFISLIVILTLVLLRLTVRCLSSSGSALISPKSKVKRKAPSVNNLPLRSPYATLRRPDHKPSSKLSDLTQATRARILNYDFDQEALEDNPDCKSNHNAVSSKNKKDAQLSKGSVKNHKNHIKETNNSANMSIPVDQLLDQPDDQSIGLIESSESKSENDILTIPGSTQFQQPPYMLTMAMKGQGSAIAAAAAAVANKRIQLAQKKNQEQQQLGVKISNGNPVFL